jgi:hypothetical protein
MVNGTPKRAVVDHLGSGVVAWARDDLGGSHFSLLGARPNPGPFSSRGVGPSPSPDCPVGVPGDCFDASPAYYETLRFTDIDGKPGDEVLARLSDGLRVWKLSDDGTTWHRLATLRDLAGSALGPNPPPPGPVGVDPHGQHRRQGRRRSAGARRQRAAGLIL